MKFRQQEIPGLYLIDTDPFRDDRGVFRRGFCAREFEAVPGGFSVKQTNISENFKKHTLRGFHFQTAPFGEDKVLTVMSGKLHNVTVDLRPDSPTFKRSVTLILNAEDRQSLLVPKGCANAFLTLEDHTNVLYYMSEFYSPENYFGFRYNDPTFNIKWPVEPAFISDKDRNFPDFIQQGIFK